MKNNIKLVLLSGIILIAFASSAQVYNINTFAGNGTGGYTGDGISAVTAEINDPEAVSVDTAGDVFITDYENNRIRMVNTLGIISTVAGNGTAGNTGNGGLATLAEINHPYGASVDSSGTLLIADGYNNCVRYVNSSGIISTVAGNGTAGYNGDGILATTAELNSPAAVAFDSIGDYFIADLSNNRVRMVTKKTGIISTVAGNGTAGYSGDGGAAVLAELNFISDVATDAKGNIYIDDFNNNCIRKVSTTGIITTIAGNGTAGYTGD
ncbi:MAG TPA: hypothetical protein VK806_07375, partial [Bacteroidia bacterium]|nr:hypothetical protein [Bacteroidia bacterium]